MHSVPDFDIIFFALARWDGPYSSTAYSLAKALSAHTRVFYFDNPFTIKDYLVHRRSTQIVMRRNALWRGKDIFLKPEKDYPNLVVVTPRLTLSINWLPPGMLYDVFSRINDHAISMAVNETCETYQIKRYLMINSFNPLIGRYLRLNIRPLLNIYQSVDDISHSRYVSKHGPRLEQEAVRNADFTIVTSSELKRLKSADSREVVLLPNAANTTIFNTAVTGDYVRPKELGAVPDDRKIICYTGNICHRLDYELLLKVTRVHSDKILLMVGPFANEQFRTSGLAQMPNVIATGRKALEDLPAYLRYSHCCIIPFLCNTLTKSIYPLKINEYLSAGKPVVSTAFSQDMLSFRSVAYVSSSHEEFVDNINRAIELDSPALAADRLVFSAGNNWESRACHFIELTEKYLTNQDVSGGKPIRGRRPKRGAGVQAV